MIPRPSRTPTTKRWWRGSPTKSRVSVHARHRVSVVVGRPQLARRAREFPVIAGYGFQGYESRRSIPPGTLRRRRVPRTDDEPESTFLDAFEQDFRRTDVQMFPCAATSVVQTAEHHAISTQFCSEDELSDVVANQQVREADLAQWESGAEFSVLSRGSGLISASPVQPVQVRLRPVPDSVVWQRMSESDTDSVPGMIRGDRV